MRLSELTQKVNEWGAREHPGYGRAIFRAGYYNYFANALMEIGDEHVKEFLVHFFDNIFRRDNPKFQPAAFDKTIAAGRRVGNGSTPTLQSRHFYYLAGEIKDIPDAHAREFCCDFVGKLCARSNGQFKIDRWREFCGIGPHIPEKRSMAYGRQVKPKALPTPTNAGPLDLD